MMVATCKIDLKSETIAGGKEGGEDYPSRHGLFSFYPLNLLYNELRRKQKKWK